MKKQRRNSVLSAYLTNLWSKYGKVTVLFVVSVFVVSITGVFSITRGSANAVTTSNLNFQARLLQASGSLVADGTYNVQFNLYDVASGGSSLWTETYLNTTTPVTIKDGYMSVSLGSLTSFPGTIDWDQELWLGMTVRGTGSCSFGACTPTDGEMTPRFKLTAVPYAFKSAVSANVQSAATNTASTASAGVSVLSGNATGSTSNSGNITIDSGTATATAGSLLFGTTNASALTIGRAGVTTTLQGSVSLTGAGAALSVTNDASIGGTLGVTGLITASGGLTVTNGDTFTNAGATLNSATAVSNVAGGGAIGTAAATVDAATTFSVNQTTAGQALTLPTPTNTAAGRIVYVNNVGSASFTMHGSVIASGASNAFMWNGTAWVTTISLSGSVVNAVGTIDSQTKSADGAVIASNAIYLQTADASYAGLVSTGTQTLAGAKTFTGAASFTAAGTGLAVTNAVTVGTNLTIGSGAGVGLFTNNGATLNATLAVANDADGGALGGGLAASASVDVYTAISINQTTASQTITLPSPTSATIGRVLYISNIGSASFTLLGTTVNIGTTATLFWNGTAWTFAGADGNGVLNQNASDQTANFRISGTGRANTSFTSPLFDSITGAVSLGTSTATGVTIGGTTNTTSVLLQGAAAATYTIGTSNNTGGITVGNSTATNTITIGASAGGSATQTINIGTSATASSTTNITVGSTIAGSTTLQSSTTNINSGTIATNQTTVNLLNTTTTTLNFAGAATNITLGATTGTLTVRNANTTLGNAAGSGLFTNNGATVNTTLAVADDANGGVLGGGLTAAASVDVYTSISVAQTTAGQTITLPTPTASTTYGRLLYLSNIGTASFIFNGVTISTGTTATLVWSNTNGGASWQFAGADGNGILNQNSADQTANFRISGTGRANTSFTTPLVDSITGALSIGTSTASSVTIGSNTNNSGLTLDSGTGAISIGTGAQARTVNIATGGAVQTLTLGSLTSTSTTTVQGGNGATAVSIQAASGGTINIATTNANDIRVGGKLVLAGGLSPDITTVGGATTTGIIIQPGAATGASSNGGDVTIKGGNGGGATAVTGGSLIFQGGNATALTGTQNGGNLTFDAGTGNTANGSLLLGSNVDGIISIGKTTGASTITLGQSTVTNSINIGSANGTTATQTINIGGGTSTTSGGKVVNIANGIPGAGTTNTIAIGSAGTTTGTVGITIGSIGAAAHVTNIQAGTGTAAGDLNILTAAGGIINIANNAVTNKVLNLGSAGSTNAASTINIATTNANQTQAVNIGATNSANNVVLIQGGTSSTAIRLAAGSAGTITVGSQTAANTVSIGTVGTAAFSSTVNIGTSTGAAQTVNVGSTGSTSSVTIDAGTGAISIGTSASARATNIATGGAVQTVTIGSTNTTSATTIAAGTGAITFNASQAQFSEVTGTRTLTVQTRTTNIAGSALTISGGTAGAGASAFTGGTLTLQGGNAGGTGNANGANVVVTGGTGVGTGVRGLVVLDTTTYTAATVQNFTANAAITQANVDTYGSILISGNTAGWIATLPDPTLTTTGRVLYITNSGTVDITLAANTVGTALSITLKPASTATMFWNGTDWTAAGASSSTDLQAAYNNTATSAGGAELVLNASGGAADGLTVRNNATTPIIGGIFEAQTSVGSNIFSVNNNAAEYAVNGGAETSTNFSTNWLAAPAGGTVARNTSSPATKVATGQASVSVVTTATTSHGARNLLASALTYNLKYNVSYTVRADSASSGFTTLETMYSSDGTATAGNVRACVAGTPTYFAGTASQSTTTITGSGTTWTAAMVGQIFVFANGASALITGFTNATTLTTSASYSQTVASQNYAMYNAGNTVKAGAWSRVSCTFTAPSSGTLTNNSIFIRQTDATARTFYVDNLSVTVSADVNHAVDGSVDDATNFTTNWTAFGASTVARNTANIYDTGASTSVVTTATANLGVRNNMAITPSVSTQYLVTFYAKSSNTFSDIRVRYSRDGGTNFVTCGDYNTQSVSTTAFTKITCLLTTDGTTATNPDLIIDQPTATARTFYIDALSVTLNTNNSNNVQIGVGAKGGPVTLFTLDRAASSPIAANNDAYLGSMYYDTTSGRIQCYEADGWGACGSAPDNYVNLNPEYAGAVLNGAGVGTMTADFCANQSGVLTVNTTLCASGESRNFYKWTSPQNSPQTYSIYVNYQLPATFKSFASDDTVQLTARTSNTTDGSVTYEMFKSESGVLTSCGTATTVTSTINTWQTVGINGNEATGCSFTTASANAFVIFKINVTAQNNANVYVGTLGFTTTGR